MTSKKKPLRLQGTRLDYLEKAAKGSLPVGQLEPGRKRTIDSLVRDGWLEVYETKSGNLRTRITSAGRERLAVAHAGPGRPSPDEEAKALHAIRYPQDLWVDITNASDSAGVSRSEWIRDACRKALGRRGLERRGLESLPPKELGKAALQRLLDLLDSVTNEVDRVDVGADVDYTLLTGLLDVLGDACKQIDELLE